MLEKISRRGKWILRLMTLFVALCGVRVLLPTRTQNISDDDFSEVFEREKRFVCSSTTGRIGNSMFAFASVYGIASAANKTVIVQKDSLLFRNFQIKAQAVDDFSICENATTISPDKHCAFVNDLPPLDGHTNYRTSSFLQSWRYFEHVADDIRNQFQFKTDLYLKSISLLKEKQRLFWKNNIRSNSLSKVVQGIKGSSPLITVGVHVRRGDIIEETRFVEYGYLVPPSDYFKRAMAYFRNKYQTTLFLVCSNDMKWSKENIIGSDVMYVEGNSYDVDMALLSLCNHSVISVGTFGWWSAFLAAGETIYYKHPARNGSELREHFSKDFSDYFYPNWIGME